MSQEPQSTPPTVEDGLTSWREMLSDAFAARGDTWESVVHCTITPEELDRRFDDGFGGTNGTPFLLWTPARVYFATEYDGSECVDSVPREPCDEPAHHIG